VSTRPYNLVAELTYRCPLRCVYCSNPVNHTEIGDGLDAAAWTRVFREAAALGIVHVGLTGGEPTARADLDAIVRGAEEAGLYTHLVTAGTTPDRFAELVGAGLRSVQLSIQDSRREPNDRIAGTDCFDRKLAFARTVREHGLPLALNFVLHRHNLDRLGEMLSLARELGAHRIELAHVQYYGWAERNKAALLPSSEQVEAARALVRGARAESGAPEIVHVAPDHLSDRPKPCMGGWARSILVVDPSGLALPCHAARALPGLDFYRVTDHPLAACWNDAPGMNAFRGESWMKEPCRGCPERAKDFGGCRCQAFLLTGDAANTDPVCALSPRHDVVVEARKTTSVRLVHRGGD
jgi:pyrroloquinoline quinone biosynthesis protein E